MAMTMRRMRLLNWSATSAKVPLASIATPVGPLNKALVPVPSALPCVEPASVETTPEREQTERKTKGKQKIEIEKERELNKRMTIGRPPREQKSEKEGEKRQNRKYKQRVIIPTLKNKRAIEERGSEMIECRKCI